MSNRIRAAGESYDNYRASLREEALRTQMEMCGNTVHNTNALGAYEKQIPKRFRRPIKKALKHGDVKEFMEQVELLLAEVWE